MLRLFLPLFLHFVELVLALTANPRHLLLRRQSQLRQLPRLQLQLLLVGTQDLVEGVGKLTELVSVYGNLEKRSWLLRLHFEYIICKA